MRIKLYSTLSTSLIIYKNAMAENYTSEITQFLQAYKAAHTDVEQRQRDGRARLWDKPQDPELTEGFKQARVRQGPYVYQNN